jgi:colicin import membrane protein
MSPKDELIAPHSLNAPVDPMDPFAYGWRYVPREQPYGSTQLVQVPLTLEDVLHPQEEDFRVHTDSHNENCRYLKTVLKARLAGTPGAVVLSDCRVAWDAEGKYGHGPDITVIFDVWDTDRDWGTFNVVHEKTRPALIIEVTSPTTRSTDLVNKAREYAAERVPQYVVADIEETADGRTLRFLNHELPRRKREYKTGTLDERGRVWLPAVKLWLAAEGVRVFCYDEAGKRLGDYVELAAELQATKKARTKAERQLRAEAAKNAELAARVKELEERLSRRNGGA